MDIGPTKFSWLEPQDTLQRKHLILAKFIIKLNTIIGNERFGPCKAHNRMKDQNNNEIFNSCETHNKTKHHNNKWNVWFLKAHN